MTRPTRATSAQTQQAAVLRKSVWEMTEERKAEVLGEINAAYLNNLITRRQRVALLDAHEHRSFLLATGLAASPR